MSTFAKKLDSFFGVSKSNSTVKTEILAGLTTFATMAYILAVNASILADSGLDQGAVFVATALASVVGTVAIGLLANLPLALAPGMGLNAFFAYTVVLGMGFSPQFALAAIFVEGLLFIVLSKTGIRTALFNSIPMALKLSVGAGIGMFILFIGLKNAGVVVADFATYVTMGSLQSAAPALALIGVAFTLVLMLKKVTGALLIGIFATWIAGIIAQFAGWYQIDVAAGAYNLLPTALVSAPPSLAPTFLLFIDGFKEIFVSAGTFFSFLAVMFTFLFVDIFDTVGTLAGVASKAKMLDEHGKLEKADEALLADAIATTVGAALGTSTTTTYIESAAGVQEGGRTGLTAMVVAFFFAISLFFAPIFLTIPGFATATALVVVGVLMLEPIGRLRFDDLEDLVPLGITIITMPLFFSISHGLAFGFISYVVVKAAVGKFKEISPLMWVLAALFLLGLIVLL
ncbi:MAG: NCS2 family permease [Oscillospiraceae bacterium]|nr:NCS2 family permease [Oscillospiraceae bacterium]